MGRNAAIAAVRGAGVARTQSILDVGCGNGDLLQMLLELGFDKLTGVDPLIEREIRIDTRVRILKADLAEVTERFDLVMMHHVLEHVEDPVGFLAEARERLAAGAQLLVRVPVAASAAWRRYGAHWVQLDAPRHRVLPSARGLEGAAERAGLRLDRVVFDSSEFQFWGSEQYRQDVPLHHPRSLSSFRARAANLRSIRRWRAEARALNERGEGDQACFYFRAG
jgi:SAM-dependent methyltransferase